MAILQSFNEVWRRTGLVQRVLLVGILLACLGAGALLVNWARQPEYRLLYSGLSSEDAAKIVEKAIDEGIPYQLKDSGTAVYVAGGRVNDLRLKLVDQGLPKSNHEGYGIFEKQKIGTSPFMQKVNHTRAKEGELAKTIEAFEMVEHAWVKLVASQDSLFGAKDSQATASVTLQLRQGRMLTGQNVSAIQYMVALGGLRGLRPEKVVVVDTLGNKLSNEGGSKMARGARGVLDHKVQTERYYVKKIEDMLIPVLGRDRVTVQVAATIDSSSTEETVETPIEGVATREITKKKTAPLTTGSGGKSVASGGMNETTSETEYMPGRTVRTKTEPGGKVTSLSVSCFVDLSGEVKEGEDASTAKPIMEIAKIEEMVRNALGEQKLVSAVKIVDTRFRKSPAAIAAAIGGGEDEGMFTSAFMIEIARRSSLGILVIGVLVALKIVRKRGKGASADAVEGEVPQTERLLAAATAATGSDRDALRSQITGALQDNPEEVKRLFLSWVKNDSGEA